MASWPSSLPQKPLADSYAESATPVTVRTDMDVGLPKVRRRYTAEIRQYGLRLLLTTAQVATLETFYITTLAHGSLTFDWLNPRTQAAATFRMVNRPGYEQAAPGYWYTSLALEELP